jgi:hypothetical protein
MQEALVACLLGVASGSLGICAYRFRAAWVGWLALAPLAAAAVYLYSPLAAGLAGLLCGLTSAPRAARRRRGDPRRRDM